MLSDHKELDNKMMWNLFYDERFMEVDKSNVSKILASGNYATSLIWILRFKMLEWQKLGNYILIK